MTVRDLMEYLGTQDADAVVVCDNLGVSFEPTAAMVENGMVRLFDGDDAVEEAINSVKALRCH